MLTNSSGSYTGQFENEGNILMASNCKLKKRTTKQLSPEEEQPLSDEQKMCEKTLELSSHGSYFWNSWPAQKTTSPPEDFFKEKVTYDS